MKIISLLFFHLFVIVMSYTFYGCYNPENYFKSQEYKERIVKDTIDGIYIPKNIEECFAQLDILLNDSLKKEICLIPAQNIAVLHMGLGLWIRNNWGLWGGSRLSVYFNNYGIYDPDEMSGIVLSLYHARLHGVQQNYEEYLYSHLFINSRYDMLVKLVRESIYSKKYQATITIIENLPLENGNIQREFKADLLSASAYCHQMLNDDSTAMLLYHQAIDNMTKIPYAYYQFAKNIYSSGETKKALSLLRKCIRMKPDYIKAWMLITNIYRQLNDSIQWIHSCQQAAYLGDKECQNVLLSMGDTMNWDINHPVKDWVTPPSEDSFFTDDTLGFWGSSRFEHFYSKDPPKFLPVDDQPVPIVMAAKSLYEGAQDLKNDTTTKLFEENKEKRGFPVPMPLKVPNDSTDVVWIKVLILEDGTVSKAFTLMSSNSTLNDYACSNLKRWKFSPAMMDHKPISVWAVVPIKVKVLMK